TFKARGELKFIEPLFNTHVHGLPLSEKFFLGGETTVRGYKPYILGPKMQNRKSDPLGGISYMLFSIEYLYQIFAPAGIFFFFDSGCISDQHFSLPKINTSCGGGLRLELMNRTPIVVGYGVPINPDQKSDVRHFFFSMGGQF
ncbi:MAG: BamA/TamA family outer membrane protein, partial [Parachlamydiales bacterium]